MFLTLAIYVYKTCVKGKTFILQHRCYSLKLIRIGPSLILCHPIQKYTKNLVKDFEMRHASSHNIKSFVFCTRMHAKRLLKYMMMITLNTQNTTDCLIHWYILCIGSVSLLCIFWLFFVACIIQDVVQQIFAFYLPPSVLIQYFPLLLHHYYDFDFMCCVCDDAEPV